MVVVIAVVVIAKQMPPGPAACSLICCPIYTDTRHSDSTLACSDSSAGDVAKTWLRALVKWRAHTIAHKLLGKAACEASDMQHRGGALDSR